MCSIPLSLLCIFCPLVWNKIDRLISKACQSLWFSLCIFCTLCQYQEQGSHASWEVLDFFLENSRTWKVLEKHFGPGKSWKNILENYAFFIGSNGKQAEIVNVPVCVDFYFYLFLKTTTVNILLHATVSAMDYTPNVVSKRCFFFIFKHSCMGSQKVLENFSRGLGKSWKSPGFFPVKEWEPCGKHLIMVHVCDCVF